MCVCNARSWCLNLPAPRAATQHNQNRTHSCAPQGARAGMSCVLLTVMRGNGDAVNFYTRLGYSEHDTSPGYDYPEEAEEYVILHKPLPKRRQPAAGGAAAGGGA